MPPLLIVVAAKADLAEAQAAYAADPTSRTAAKYQMAAKTDHTRVPTPTTPNYADDTMMADDDDDDAMMGDAMVTAKWRR